METPYRLPGGPTLRILDSATAGGALEHAVQSWREGVTEALYFGDDGRPDGVVISFGQWAAYESIGRETRFERRLSGLAASELSTGQNAEDLLPETVYKVGNGLSVRVIDTARADQLLGRAVRRWRDGEAEPLFYGADGSPEGVAIPFGRWTGYEGIELDADYDGRVEAGIHEYQAPNGDTLYLNSTAGVGRTLGRILELIRTDDSEPVFFADELGRRPEGAIISFRAWLAYEVEREDAAEERRREEVFRRLEERHPSRKVTYEEAAREGGWDPGEPGVRRDVEADHERRVRAALHAVITAGEYPLPNGTSVAVTDVSTVAESLSDILAKFRTGSIEPVFFTGDQSRPEAVVMSFDQWADYEELREDAEADRRRYDLVRRRLADSDPSTWVTFEEMMDEWGLDPDSLD
jgi:hypothetical protein